MSPRLGLTQSSLEAFCRKHHVKRLSLFGSELKGQATSGSDLDLLVEFDEAHLPGLLALAAMETELSALMGGRKVDLRTPRDLSRHFRNDVIRTAEVQFAQ